MADLRKGLLDTYFVPGSIWKTFEKFRDGTARNKFLIVIRISERFVFYLLPTSKPEYFQRAKHCSYVQIEAGTQSCFHVDTFIGCDRFRSKERSEWVELCNKNRIKYEGKLADKVFEQIENALKASRVLSEAEKRYILG